MSKLGRNYRLTIDYPTGIQQVVEPPFTIEFDITRNILSRDANVCVIKLYNLSEDTRVPIHTDPFLVGIRTGIELKAGYGKNLATVFKGNIKEAKSSRDGTNMVTTIECFDGGFAYVNSNVAVNFPAGTSRTAMIQTLLMKLREQGLSPGKIGTFPGESGKGTSFVGNACDIINELSDGKLFIDNEVAHVIGEDECITGSLLRIDSEAGLLGTPFRSAGIMSIEMLFEPRMIIGQLVELASVTAKNYNTFYKVIAVQHRATISQAVCGDARTTIKMYYGAESLRTVT